jgi:hypothetical protein
VIAGLHVEGTFSEQRRMKMKRPGRHVFCGYLSSDQDTPTGISAISLKVRRPLLKASRARDTVALALRRHGFADRVVASLRKTCERRSRAEFECRCESTFPGYRLSGSGTVALSKRLSYRFRVVAQGQAFTLTDENEGRLPG